MTLPASGAISLNDVNVELGLSATAQIGMNDAAVRALFEVPSGAISMSDGYGKSAYYTIARSLRLRSSASAYLSRTIGSTPSSRTTMTLSMWVKRGVLSNNQEWLFGTVNNYEGGRFWSDDTLYCGVPGGATWITSASYRDPSAWYHFIFVNDTTNANAADRFRLYVNNVRQTFSTSTAITQNQQTAEWNVSSVLNTIGNQGTASRYFDGYITEVNFIDGQALNPSSFGEYNADIGAWQPIQYSGSYGTNGFYLNFSNNANTTTLGYDQSSNSNNWTTNNISLTAGATYDSMTDVPTLTGVDAANYAVVSPIGYRTTTPTPTISSGNLNVVCPSSSLSSIGTSTFGVSSGKWYWEVTKTGTAYGNVGVVRTPFNMAASSSLDLGGLSNEYVYVNSGSKFNNNSSSSYGASWTNNDVIGVALDLDAGTLTFYKNGTSQGTAFSSLPSGTYLTGGYDSYNGAGFIFNFGQRPFAYTPPTGFKAPNTYNLSDSTVLDGGEYFNTALYTANNSSTKAVTGVGFAPDLVWVKARNVGQSHYLGDTVRGNNLFLQSDSTGADTTATNWITYGSDGFTLNNVYGNTASYNYVGWNWRASDSSPVSNNAGSITSTVSANTTAGFSIVTYTGNQTAGATIGHGLGSAPKMLIAKGRGQNSNWVVKHESLASNQYLYLNGTIPASSTWNIWNSTSPTSSVFTIGNDAGINESGYNYLAYCFAPVEGFSAFGSYTGNGSSDGTFVYLGFRPAFILTKRTDISDSWRMYDSARNPYNAGSYPLYPNLSNAEDLSTNHFDWVSNGFKCRSSSINASGVTYIYMAFAENPFKNSLAV